MTHPHTRPYGPKRHREGQPDLRGLDDVHRRLVSTACSGEVAEFEETDVLDADVLAALITGRSYKGRALWTVAPKGVQIKGGRVETRLDLSQSRIEWPIELKSMMLPKGIDLANAFTKEIIFDHCVVKDIHFPGAVITGQFGAVHTAFTATDGDALWAQAAEITEGMFLDNAILKGQCDLTASKIFATFSATEAVFEAPSGDAIRAQSVNILGSVCLDNAKIIGVCDFNGANISGAFSANHTSFDSPNGTALRAQRATFTNSIFLNYALLNGICDFTSAKAAEILLRGSTLIGMFRGDFGSNIKRLDLRETNFISLRHAQLSDENKLSTALSKASKSPDILVALDLTDAQVGRLDMPQSPQHSIRGIVVLTRCHVEHFCDHKHSWPESLVRKQGNWEIPQSRLDPETGEDIGYYILNGFTYDYLAAPNGGSADGAEESTAQARKRWLLSQHTHDIADHFKPQPWRQMAARLETQGHDDAARKIALFRRQIHRQSKAVTGWRVMISWLLDKLSHYGFNPWLTMAWSAGVIALWALAYGGFAATGPMPSGGYQPLPMVAPALVGPASDANANPPPVFIRAQADDVTAATNINDLAQADPFLSRVYPDFNPLLYSLDVFVPVLDLGMEAYWRPNPNHLRSGFGDSSWMIGSILYWLTIVQRFVGAILIAIMVTSFTGLLTREDKLS